MKPRDAALALMWLAALAVGACGGRATGDAPSGDGSGGMSSGTGGAAASGGAQSSTGGAGSLPALCSLPLDGGDCDGYSEVYGYTAQDGCVPFVYGLCGGNANRFSTIEECTAACAPDRAACENPADCVLRAKACCGGCSLDELEAVNVAYADPEVCPDIACEPCADDGYRYFTATCEAGSCVAYDARAELTKCATDDDCELRNGLECCEACDGSHWVAVSKTADFSAMCAGVECDACLPPQPTDLAPQCYEGVCAVGWPFK